MIKFITSTITELKKVDWLKKSTAARYSLVVISFLVLGTLYVLLLDEVLTELRTQLLFQNI